MSLITSNAQDKIETYNSGYHEYNEAANAIYAERDNAVSIFDRSYLRMVILGLIKFDMLRWMDETEREAYSFDGTGFGARLESKLAVLQPKLEPFLDANILSVDLASIEEALEIAYSNLAAGGSESLHRLGNRFDVGATKILHFLIPKLFIIVDKFVARAFAAAWQVPFAKNPVHSLRTYRMCLKHAQSDICAYAGNLQALEPYAPLPRIYDKLAFITGREASKGGG